MHRRSALTRRGSLLAAIEKQRLDSALLLQSRQGAAQKSMDEFLEQKRTAINYVRSA